MKKTTISLVLVAVIGLSVALGKAMLERSGPSETPNTASSVAAKPAQTADAADASGPGMTAIADAARANKYLFVFFWKQEDEQTAAMKDVFEEAMKRTNRAQSAIVSTTDPAERGIVTKFDLQRAPMPLVLALAPNGAVMGGFPTKFTEQELLEAFASPGSEKCMKALQENKLVLLCVQNGSTKSNEEAMKGVRDFKGDSRFGHATEVVMLDPADTAERSFLADLKIDPQEPEAMTAFLVPPGSVVAEFKGATDKEELAAALQKASTFCGPGGCGPGGCGPKK
jgi:hypothetical protein